MIQEKGIGVDDGDRLGIRHRPHPTPSSLSQDGRGGRVQSGDLVAAQGHSLGARGPGTSDYMLRTLRALVE